jgi:DNA polymerase I
MDLVNAFWVRVGDKLGIKAKLESGEWRLIEPSIKPYFFIRASDLERARGVIESVKGAEVEKGDFVTTRGEPCLKVVVDFPTDVRRIREKLKGLGIPTYEADVRFVRRWMIDTGLRASKRPRVLYFDVEADPRKGIWTIDSGPPTQRMLSIAAVDSTGKEFFICDDDEVQMFEEFKKLMLEYDLLVGYNNFRWDNPYIEARARVLGVDFNPRITNWQDMMLLYNKSWGGGYVSLRLDKVAEKELGVGKKHDLSKLGGADWLYKAFLGDREALKEYNMWDAMLLKMLNEKLGCLDVAIEMANISHCLYEDALYNSRIIDGLLLRKSLFRSPRIVYQNKFGMAYKFGSYARGEEKKDVEHYTGGLVIDPKPGLFHDVVDFDFTSLYPRIIMTFNIGLETADENGDISTGSPKVRFRSSPRSIIAEFLEELSDLRNYYKELLKEAPPDDPKRRIYNVRQYELKILLNAAAGVLGAHGFRFYEKDIAESVTLTGREVLKMAMEILSELGFEILYCDTDGTFARKEGLNFYRLKEKERDLVQFVNEELRERVVRRFNVPPEYYCLELKVDKVYSKIFFTPVKKRYVGEVYDPEGVVAILDEWRIRSQQLEGIPVKRDVVGFDVVRLDVPNIVKIVQQKIFDVIFRSETRDEVRRGVQEVLRMVRKLLFSGALDEELVIEKGTRREIGKYRSVDVHVKIAKKLLEHGLFRPGDSVEYVITDVDKDGVVGAPIIRGEPFPKITSRGYNYYWERITKMAERILGEKINLEERSLKEWI